MKPVDAINHEIIVYGEEAPSHIEEIHFIIQSVEEAAIPKPLKMNIFMRIALRIWQGIQLCLYTVSALWFGVCYGVYLVRLGIYWALRILGFAFTIAMTYPIWYGIYYLVTEKLF